MSIDKIGAAQYFFSACIVIGDKGDKSDTCYFVQGMHAPGVYLEAEYSIGEG